MKPHGRTHTSCRLGAHRHIPTALAFQLIYHLCCLSNFLLCSLTFTVTGINKNNSEMLVTRRNVNENLNYSLKSKAPSFCSYLQTAVVLSITGVDPDPKSGFLSDTESNQFKIKNIIGKMEI